MRFKIVGGGGREAIILSPAAARRVLGVSAAPLARLLETGFLPSLAVPDVMPLERSGRVAVTHGALPVLRVGGPKAVVESGRQRTIGVSTKMSKDDFLKSTTKYWTCDAESVVAEGMLAVAVSGWVVATLAISGINETTETPIYREGKLVTVEKRIAFDATLAGRVKNLACLDPELYPCDPEVAASTARMLGARVPSRQGAPLVMVRPGE